MFRDRTEAGEKLGSALIGQKKKDPIVLAIPRGGVEVGYQVARRLNSRFSLAITRKLPLPENPEAGFGAVAEDGSVYLVPEAKRRIPDNIIRETAQEQVNEIKRRISVLRGNRPLPPLTGETVILVDDGIAMGSTMRATVEMCRNSDAGEIIVAAPVTGPRVEREFRKLVDKVVILEVPPDFHAVAQVYENWYDVPDQEVMEIMMERGYDTESLRFPELL